ncbi:MAG: hypothetical protein H7222_16265 [Methylotenera sp.]|nr:hypothetical protein [Oligoflexia bacterium]
MESKATPNSSVKSAKTRERSTPRRVREALVEFDQRFSSGLKMNVTVTEPLQETSHTPAGQAGFGCVIGASRFFEKNEKKKAQRAAPTEP